MLIYGFWVIGTNPDETIVTPKQYRWAITGLGALAMEYNWVHIVGVGFTLASVLIGFAFWFGSWKKGVETDISAIKDTTSDINSKVSNLTNLFLSMLLDGVLNSRSPRTLSNLGKKISKELGARQLAESLAPHLVERSKGLSAYDIQNLCNEYVHQEYTPDPDVEEQMKSCAYSNGISIISVLSILAVELRDVLLALGKHGQ